MADSNSIATGIKRKRPPTFQHYPVDKGMSVNGFHNSSHNSRINSEEVEKSLGGKDQDQVKMEGSEEERSCY